MNENANIQLLSFGSDTQLFIMGAVLQGIIDLIHKHEAKKSFFCTRKHKEQKPEKNSFLH